MQEGSGVVTYRRDRLIADYALQQRPLVQTAELPSFRVNVYWPQTKTIFEFFGCFGHGHTCQPFRDAATLIGDTLVERYERTMSRLEQITRAGYQFMVRWECEFEEKSELLTHPVVRQTPRSTRDALYGGRTEAIRLYFEVRENETIHYMDVMSLYPYICKYFKFPVVHSTIHVGDMCKDVEACLRMVWLIKCTIVPPKKLYLPVLPYRCNNKLIFSLCRTCVQTCCVAECSHTKEDDRDLTGTRLMGEVRGKRVPDTRNLWGLRISGHTIQPRKRRGRAFHRQHKQVLEIESAGERLSRLGSKPCWRRAVYRVVF